MGTQSFDEELKKMESKRQQQDELLKKHKEEEKKRKQQRELVTKTTVEELRNTWDTVVIELLTKLGGYTWNNPESTSKYQGNSTWTTKPPNSDPDEYHYFEVRLITRFDENGRIITKKFRVTGKETLDDVALTSETLETALLLLAKKGPAYHPNSSW